MSRNDSYYKSLETWKGQPNPNENEIFTDPAFPPNENSLLSKDLTGEFIDKYDGNYYAKKINKDEIEWKRPKDIFIEGNYCLFNSEIEIDDLSQGNEKNYYFVSALQTLTEYPHMIYQSFLTKEISPVGCYEIILFIDGKFQKVLIDDYLPVNSQTNELIFAKPNQKENKKEIWLCLLEKAWAKVNGGYSNIIKGTIDEVLEAITGLPSMTFVHKATKKDYLWKYLHDALKKKYIISCISKENVEDLGLPNIQAYTLVELHEITSDQETIELVGIRNPWGNGYNGPWGNGSSLWKEEEKYQIDNFDNKDKFVFYMLYDDFYKYFSSTNICKIFPENFSKSFPISQQDADCGNVLNIYLEKPAFLTVSLLKKNWRFNREVKYNKIPSYVAIVKYEVDNSENENENENENNYIEETKFTEYDAKNDSYNDVTLTKYLLKGFYIVYAYNDIAHSTLKNKEGYIIKVDSDRKFKCVSMPKDEKNEGFPLLKNIITDSVVYIKQNFDPNKDYTTFASQIKQDGLGHRLVYNPTDNWYVYQENLQGLINMYMLSPPNINNNDICEWYIPPHSSDIILGMCDDSKYPVYFGLKPNIYSVDSQPLNYNEQRADSKVYANKNVKSELYTDDSYYDYISLPFGKVCQILSLKKIDLSENAEEQLKSIYPQIMEHLYSLPENAENSADLIWVEIQYDEQVYIGQVNKKRKQEGRGAILYNNKDLIVVGQFKDGLLNGEGIIFDRSYNKIYEGEFANGQKSGKGTYVYSNGDLYEGEFKNDLMNGMGTYTFKGENGDKKWEGNFTEGQMDGEGLFTEIDGSQRDVKFQNGDLCL